MPIFPLVALGAFVFAGVALITANSDKPEKPTKKLVRKPDGGIRITFNQPSVATGKPAKAKKVAKSEAAETKPAKLTAKPEKAPKVEEPDDTEETEEAEEETEENETE